MGLLGQMLSLRVDVLLTKPEVNESYSVFFGACGITYKYVFEFEVVMAVSSGVHNTILCQELHPNLDGSLKAEWSFSLVQNAFESFS